MIKEKEILVKINQRNKLYYEKLGYLIKGKEIYANTLDIPKGSHNVAHQLSCKLIFKKVE